MKAKIILLSISLGLGLTLGCLFLVKITASAALDTPHATYCVRPGGGSGCYATIQEAVNASANGDTIRVATGEYHERVLVNKTVYLQGGWDTSFTTWSWMSNQTTINADGLDSAVRIEISSTAISPTIEGFNIINGDASSYLGWGGGILVNGTWNGPGLVTIRSNSIYKNIACKSEHCQGYGGGIMVYSSRVIIEDNFISQNIARLAGKGSGHGGGIAIWGFPMDAYLSGNLISDNTAIISTTGEYATGEGGGLWSQGGAGVIATGNWIRENVAAEKGLGKGGGIFTGGSYDHNEIISNTASLDGIGYGGGVYSGYTADFQNNLVRGNIASQNATGMGGGIYIIYLHNANGNMISKNRASRGGGLYYQEYNGQQRLYGNLITNNIANGLDSDIPDGGGGILSQADWLEITDNQILTNTGLAGGGLLVTAGEKFLLQNNLVRGNLSLVGGGLYLQDTGGKLQYNQIDKNKAAWWGGGLYLAGNSGPLLDGNIVMDNLAVGHSGLGAGGVAIAVSSSTHVTMTNSIIADNTINSGVASGIHCYSGACSLIHCTIVDNKFGLDPGEGVRISALGGANQVWNSISAGHSTGVVIVGSPSVSLDYNDYYDNSVNVSPSASPGEHSLFVAAMFMDRLGNDYHLSSGSPLINTGDSNLTVPNDFEGQPRISRPDIGADEFNFGTSYLPLLVK